MKVKKSILGNILGLNPVVYVEALKRTEDDLQSRVQAY